MQNTPSGIYDIDSCFFFDVETTLNKNNEIIMANFVAFDPKSSKTYSTWPIFNRSVKEEIMPCAAAWHGWTKQRYEEVSEMIVEKTETDFYSAILHEFSLMPEGTQIIGYNIKSFDLDVLDKNLKRLNLPVLDKSKFQIIDLYQFAKKYFKKEDLGDFTCKTVFVHLFPDKVKDLFNVPLGYASMSEIWMCIEIYKWAVNKFGQDGLVKYLSEPTEVKTIEFGKYKGKSPEWIVNHDKGYLTWLLNDVNLKEKDPDLFYTLKKLINEKNQTKNSDIDYEKD